MNMLQFDVSTVLLNGILNEKVFVSQPPGYDDQSGRVYLLHKDLYGLRQSSRAWNKKFTDVMTKLNFKQSTFDTCIYSMFIRN